jgi:tetratricopeptide (TPR) repeat protein
VPPALGRDIIRPVSPPRSLIIERFKRLPRRSSDVWQGGVVRARTLVERPDGSARRPWAAVWVSLATSMMNIKLAEDDGAAADASLALEVLVDLGLKFTRSRPAGLEVADGTLGAELAEALADPELTVSARADLPAVDRVVREMEKAMGETPPLPEALDAAGVTVERMRAFAEAARDFYQAAPWQHLSDEDLIHVEAPAVASGMRHLTVLGAAGQTFGLGFFANPRDFEALHESPDPRGLLGRKGKWTVLYGPIDEMPFGDADLWDHRRLAVAGPSAYPVAMWYGTGGNLRRPRAQELADLTAILLALARSAEADIDRGRWSHEVPGHDGPLTVALAIPDLLAPLDAPPPRRQGVPDRRAMERLTAEVQRFTQGSLFDSLEDANAALRQRFSGPIDDLPSTATTPLENAQDLMYRAFDARGRRRIKLARKALEVSADCADAYVVLAEHSHTPEAARALYEQALAAGERALGADVFEQEAGRFWGLVPTRPYMRARLGPAQTLEVLDRNDEAIEHYRELLRLDAGDSQGVRYALLSALLVAERDTESAALIEQFGDEPTAVWHYGRALVVFRREGDSRAARECLRTAQRTNRHVPQYITGDDEWPGPEPTAYAPGGREEAVICDADLGDAWRATPDAIRWLRAQAPARRSGKRRRR